VVALRTVSMLAPNWSARLVTIAASRAIASIGEPGLFDDKKISATPPSG
jgi:hypothetical protein